MSAFFRQLILVLVCFGAGVAPSWAKGYPAPVKVAALEQRLMAPVAWVAGEVVSKHRAQVSAEVEGRITWVAEEGQRVRAGDVVARLDDTLFKLGLSEARAEVEREQARLTFLKQEVERLQRLARQNNAARTQLDETLAERDGAISSNEAAKVRVYLAKERLDRTLIHAPFDAMVTKRHKREGEWVNMGSEVVGLLDVVNIEIEASVSLSLSHFIHVGQRFSVRLANSPLSATLRVIVPVGEGDSRLMRLKFDLPKGSASMAGQYVRVAMPMANPRDVLTMPRDALVLRGSGNSVYRVKSDNTAEKLVVETGIAVGDYIEVLGDVLQLGDQVIIRGGERLRPGQPLRILGAEAKTKQRGAGQAVDKVLSGKGEGGGADSGKNKWWSGEQSSEEKNEG